VGVFYYGEGKQMAKKSNECKQCTNFKYDRANRQWVCANCNKVK